MDENGKKFALTLFLWLAGIAFLFIISFVMLVSSCILVSPDTLFD